jgi:trans-aconitate methyltransferase
MLERIALAQGEAVLDVGCGPGTDVFDMVELVGPAGRLVGLDASEVMIAEARRRAKELRQLPRLFKEQHLEVLSIDPVQVFVHYALAELFLGSHLAEFQTNGTLSGGWAQQWWEYLQHAVEYGTLLISFTAFIIVGAKS